MPSDPSGQSSDFDREGVLQVFRDLEAKGQLVRPIAELEEMTDGELLAYAIGYDAAARQSLPALRRFQAVPSGRESWREAGILVAKRACAGFPS